MLVSHPGAAPREYRLGRAGVDRAGPGAVAGPGRLGAWPRHRGRRRWLLAPSL